MIQAVKITRIKEGSREGVEDFVAEEVPFTVNAADRELVTLLCTPSNLKELAMGFLFTSGLIKKAGDARKIVVDEERWTANVDLPGIDTEPTFKRLYTSGLRQGGFVLCCGGYY